MQEQFIYTDADGTVVGRVDRCDVGDVCDFPRCVVDAKHFLQLRHEYGRYVMGLSGKKLPLFRLPDVREHITDPIFVTEGERKANALAQALEGVGYTAAVTTVAGGSNESLTPEHLAQLKGCKRVTVLADSDTPGRAAAQARAQAIVNAHPKADVRVVDLFPDRDDSSDVHDFLAAGGTFLAFCDMLDAAQPLQAESDLDEIERLSAAYAARQLAEPCSVAVVPAEYDSDTRRYLLGIDSIDVGMGGRFRPGEFFVIGGRPGEGKTALALQMALANGIGAPMIAARMGHPAGEGTRIAHTRYRVLVVTLEMTAEDIRDRLLSAIMRQNLDTVEMARIHRTDYYAEAVSVLADSDVFVFEPKPPKLGMLADKSIDAIIAAALKLQADMVIIDWARMITGWRPGDPGGVCSAIVERLLEYAKATRLFIVLVAQLQREAQGKRPILSQYQDCGLIEQLAHKAILLWQPFFGKVNNNAAEVIVAKNRRGPPFRAPVWWTGATASFHSMTQEEEERTDQLIADRGKIQKANAS